MLFLAFALFRNSQEAAVGRRGDSLPTAPLGGGRVGGFVGLWARASIGPGVLMLVVRCSAFAFRSLRALVGCAESAISCPVGRLVASAGPSSVA